MARLGWIALTACLAMAAAPLQAEDAVSSSIPSMAPMPDASSPATPDAAMIADWQGVIHSQIQAFRDHDAVAALSYAAATFHKTYADPNQFFAAIVGAGYGPIVDSRSETFGPYAMMAADVVYQDVKFVGKDQALYEAVYRLGREPDGWRVEGVELVKTPGVGV